MHSILVALKAPDPNSRLAVNDWHAAIDAIRNGLPQTTEVDEIAEGVFLIRGSSGLPVLGRAVAVASQSKFSYKVLFIESATEWKREAVA